MAEAPLQSIPNSGSDTVLSTKTVLGISVVTATSFVILLCCSFNCYYRLYARTLYRKRSVDIPEFPDRFPGDGSDIQPELPRSIPRQDDSTDISRAVLKEETQNRLTGNVTGMDVSTVEGGTDRRLADVSERKLAHQRPGMKIGSMNYINKVLRLLFALFGLFTIFFSVILDNSFNDRPVRFTGLGILAPVMVFQGLLATGWFPRIPLRFIACVKRRGFLKHVMPCSPWHDNVVTDFTGGICTLEPLEHRVHSQLPEFVQVFLYGTSQDSSQNTVIITPSTLDLDPRIQDLQEPPSSWDSQVEDSEDMSGITKEISSTLDSQSSLPNLQEALPPVEHIVVQIDHSSMFYVSDDERMPMQLTIGGPEINGLSVAVEAFKNTSTRDPTFDLSCVFRDKRTRKMYLTVERLHYLAQNMLQWVENLHLIVVDASRDILHCMAIQDILWEFTRGLYTFKSVHVEHHFLAGMVQIRSLIIWLYVFVSCALNLIPLLSDKKSYFFLFFVVVVVPYLYTLDDTNLLSFYNFRSLLCPIIIKIWGFCTLYMSRSLFRWCNEFRQERVLNPAYFWIDKKYSNRFLSEGESLFDFKGFVELSDSPKNESFVMTYKDDPTKKPHIGRAYKLSIIFDTVKPNDTCYTNVSLIFSVGDDVLGRLNRSAIEIKRLNLIEKLFQCYSDPNFGGYVEAICPGFRKGTYLGHSPRFLEMCYKIMSDKKIPTLLVASRMLGSKFIIGEPFWSSTTPNVL